VRTWSEKTNEMARLDWPQTAEANRASCYLSIVAQAAGRIWLIGLRANRAQSRSGTLVAEVGLLAIPAAPSYELVVAEAVFQPGIHSRAFICIRDLKRGI